MNRASGKILSLVLSAGLLFYVGYQVYRSMDEPIKTEAALSYTVQDVKRIKGLIIRSEAVMEEQVSGIVSYCNEDGVKVTYGTEVAEVYASKEDVNNRRRIQELEQELSQLESIQNPGNNYFLNSEAISKQIDENLYAVIACNESRDLSDMTEYKSALLTNLNKKQLATGVVKDFSGKEEQLRTEKERLEQSLSGSSQQTTADRVGYFSSYVDGLEQELTPEILGTITVEELQEYIDGRYEQDPDRLGKIIRQSPWYFAALIPEDEAITMQEGSRLKIDFGISGYPSISGKLVSLREEKGSDQVIAVVSCDYMSAQLSRLRNPSAELIFQVYSGIRIPDRAIRFRDNVRGVYVSTGAAIEFKTVDVIYEGNGYVISRINELNGEQVQLYDEIIVSGIIPEGAIPEKSSSEEGDAGSEEAETSGSDS